MNAVTATEPRAQLATGGDVAAIVPQNIDEAFRLANAIFKSNMAPQSLKSAEQVMVAMIAGAELGMKPFQAVRHIAVVNNRPTLWGDGLIAVARSQGVRVKETVEGEDLNAVATCTVTRPDTGEEITRTFSASDAKKAGLWGKAGPWQQYPKRMLQMRARAFALRDGAADILNGFQVAEEVQDYTPVRDITEPRASAAEALRIEAAAPAADLEIVDQDEPEVTDAQAEEVTAQARDLFGDDATDDDFPGDRKSEGAQ